MTVEPGAQRPCGRCPCGTGDAYDACCGRFHERFARTGELSAPTAEALMRSRFCAFARLGEAGDGAAGAGDGAADESAAVVDEAAVDAMVAYLRATWTEAGRPSAADLTPSTQEPAARFTRLAVLDVEGGGPFQDEGIVEFVALGRHAGEGGGRFRLHERSRFRRADGAWLYVDGQVR